MKNEQVTWIHSEKSSIDELTAVRITDHIPTSEKIKKLQTVLNKVHKVALDINKEIKL